VLRSLARAYAGAAARARALTPHAARQMLAGKANPAKKAEAEALLKKYIK
jgi:hypothetical protein